MGVLIQKTVKVTPELNARIERITEQLGCKESQFMIQCFQGVFDMIDNPRAVMPRVVCLGIAAKAHKAAPLRLLSNSPPAVNRMSWW
jgi:hypothetical protein